MAVKDLEDRVTQLEHLVYGNGEVGMAEQLRCIDRKLQTYGRLLVAILTVATSAILADSHLDKLLRALL